MFINGIEWQLSSLVTFDSCYSNSIDTAPYSIDHIFKRQFKFILNTLDWIDSNIHSDTLRMVLVLKTVNMNMEHHHLTENLGLNFILFDWEFYCRSQFRFVSIRLDMAFDWFEWDIVFWRVSILPHFHDIRLKWMAFGETRHFSLLYFI